MCVSGDLVRVVAFVVNLRILLNPYFKKFQVVLKIAETSSARCIIRPFIFINTVSHHFFILPLILSKDPANIQPDVTKLPVYCTKSKDTVLRSGNNIF